MDGIEEVVRDRGVPTTQTVAEASSLDPESDQCRPTIEHITDNEVEEESEDTIWVATSAAGTEKAVTEPDGPELNLQSPVTGTQYEQVVAQLHEANAQLKAL